jgi:hypothetical protein
MFSSAIWTTARLLEAGEEGPAAAERGESIEEEEMDVRIEGMFQP